MQLAADSILEVGRELIEQKKTLGHGNFLPWIEAEFGMSEDSAARFINVANNLGDKFRSVRNLAPTALYALAAKSTPTEVREQVEERAAKGERRPQRPAYLIIWPTGNNPLPYGMLRYRDELP
jgi:hypothetical protein